MTTSTPSFVPLFLHIPKSGGSTLASLIYDEHASIGGSETIAAGGWFRGGLYYYPRGFFKEREFNASEAEIQALSRADLRAVTGHFSYGIHKHIAGPSRYFSMLRDPSDRVASLYFHLRTYESDGHGEAAKQVTLHEFLTTVPLRELDNDQVRRIAGVEPQYGHCTTSMLELAKENLKQQFFLVGATDLFDETLVLLRESLQWSYINYVPRLVNTERQPTKAIPRKTLDLIEELNEYDRALYEYAKAQLVRRLAEGGPPLAGAVRDFKKLNAEHIEKYGVY